MINTNKLSFQIVSDLHIEYRSDTVPEASYLIKPISDILILAGDIGSLYKYKQLYNFLKQLSKMFKMILYIPGNHEFYTIDNIVPLHFGDLLQRLTMLENSIENLHILNQKSIIIDNICIAGCTLWSETNLALPRFIVRIPDFNKYVYNKIHKSDLSYIENMIDYCQKENLKLVVVTHHCPTFKVLENILQKKDRFKSLYVTDLERLLSKDKVDTWICGHIHHNFDFITKSGTRVVGNQKGKPKDKITDYSNSFVVEIGNENDEGEIENDEGEIENDEGESETIKKIEEHIIVPEQIEQIENTTTLSYINTTLIETNS